MLTMSGIIAKTVDFLTRAWYSARLGSEGMGIFSLVFSVHGIMLTVATGGLGVAVATLVSEQYARRSLGEIRKTMRIALCAVALLSLPVIITASAASEKIASAFLGEPRCAKSIVCLAPSVLFMGISYCIKGYFYASRKVLRPASSEFLEQAVKVCAIGFLLPRRLAAGAEAGCAAVFLGFSVGEFSSCLYLTLLYLADCRTLRGISRSDSTVRAVARIALPVMATSLISSFLRMQEDVWIVSGLEMSGLDHTAALSSYGALHGMIMPLLSFPLTLLSSFLTLLVPEISRAASLSCRVRLQTLVSRIYRFTAFFGFMIMCIFISFSPELTHFAYGDAGLGTYLRCLAPLAPVMFMDSVSCGILNGLGRQPFLLKCSLADSALRLALIALLIPHFGINSLIFIIIFSNLFTFTLTGTYARRGSGISFEVSSCIAKPLFAAICAAAAVHTLFSRIADTSALSALITGCAAAAAVYSFAAAFLGAPSRSDIRWAVRRMLLDRV